MNPSTESTGTRAQEAAPYGSSLGELTFIVREMRGAVQDIREALFTGHGDRPPILSRLATLEERVSRIDRMLPRSGVWAGVGSLVGSMLAAMLAYLGLRSGQ